jgi:hypothetical protein
MNGASSTTLTFQGSEQLFLDRGVFVEVDVPVVLTRKTALTGNDPKATDYLSKSNYFKDIAFRQYGILSCVDQINIQFNQNAVTNISNVFRCFEMTSEYYSSLMVNKFFPASQPDRFTDYRHYSSDGATVVDTLNEDGDAIQYLIPAVAEENIFTGGYSNQYNSRRPAFKFISATLGEIRLLVKTFMYIPYSFFSSPADSFSLYGINTLSVQLTFVENFVKRLFVTNSDYWSDISFDNSAANQNKHKATMHLITYQAPDYVAKAMFDPNGMIKPYRVGYNKLVPFPQRSSRMLLHFQKVTQQSPTKSSLHRFQSTFTSSYTLLQPPLQH